MPYLFVAASVIAVLAISFIVKWNMDKIKYNPEDLLKAQQNLFLGAGAAEVIPIILVVLGFAKMNTADTDDLFTPILIIIILMAFAVIFILMQVYVGVPEKIKGRAMTFGLIGISLSLAIPIVSLVALATMF